MVDHSAEKLDLLFNVKIFSSLEEKMSIVVCTKCLSSLARVNGKTVHFAIYCEASIIRRRKRIPLSCSFGFCRFLWDHILNIRDKIGSVWAFYRLGRFGPSKTGIGSMSFIHNLWEILSCLSFSLFVRKTFSKLVILNIWRSEDIQSIQKSSTTNKTVEYLFCVPTKSVDIWSIFPNMEKIEDIF